MILFLCLAVLLVLVLTALPLAVLILTSFRPRGVYGFSEGPLSFDNFAALLDQSGLGTLLVNTFVYVFGTIAISVVFAGLWAWVTERTDFRFKVAVRVLMLLTFALPSLIQGLGWTLLLNPSNGYINELLREIFNLESPTGPLNIYTMGMMIFVSSFLLTPPVYVMLAGVIKHLDYKLEFPAILAGVPARTIFARVLLPILLPGLLSVLIYTVMIMVQVFDIPLSIGLTAGIQVLSTRIYLLSSSELGSPNYNLAAAFGVLLILFSMGLVTLYRHMTRVSERFAVISGKNYRLVVSQLGARRWLVYVFGAAFFLVAFAPILMLAWTSLLPFYATPSMEAWDTVSLKNYSELFHSAMFRKGLLNSVIVVLVGATITMLVSFVVSYATMRPVGFWRKTVDTLAFLPIAIPHIVLGLAVLLLYVKTPLYGTLGAIILAQISVNMVFGTRTLSAALIQVNRDLERAAAISGVPRGTVLMRILAPIIRGQFFNGWLLVFASSVRDVGVPLVFLTSETVVLSSALWLIWGYPNVPGASALAVVIVLFLAVFVTPLQMWVSRLEDRGSS